MDNQEYPYLLSIGIPTYNRSKYLDLCLSQFFKQIKPFGNVIEVIISNNCSTDDTEIIVENYINQGFKIKYIKNSENIGADRNVEQCFSLAKGNFFWLFCDDDVLIDGSVDLIVDVLKNNLDVGDIFVSSYSFVEDYSKEMPSNLKPNTSSYQIFNSSQEYLKKINYRITFGTGSIVNKNFVPTNFASNKYVGSNLNHLHWLLLAAFNAKKNIIVNDICIANKSENTGGYALVQTFGINLQRIMYEVATSQNQPTTFVDFTINLILKKFLPYFIIFSKLPTSRFTNEKNPFWLLYSIHKHNKYFWLFTVPSCFTPNFIAKIIFYLKK